MKKFLIGVIFGLVTSAFAIPKGPCDQPKDACCKKAIDSFAFSYPKDVGISCPRDFYVYADFLWMKAIEEGLDYAIRQTSRTQNTDPVFPLGNGEIKGFSSGSQEWDWRPGFRVGLGYYYSNYGNWYGNWNFNINWTYLRIKADSISDYSACGGNYYIYGLFYPPITECGEFLPVPHISARWSGDLDTLDLNIGKSFHVSRYFISNPKFGFRAAWIEQHFHVRHYIYGLKRNVYHQSGFWGFGLRGLYEGDLLLSPFLFLYGKVAFSLLYGRLDAGQVSDYLTGYLEQYSIINSFYKVQPNAELAIGISWSRFFHKEEYKVALNVGYEFHQWWNQNQIRRFFDENPVSNKVVSRGDLSFSGFSFGLNVDF